MAALSTWPCVIARSNGSYPSSVSMFSWKFIVLSISERRTAAKIWMFPRSAAKCIGLILFFHICYGSEPKCNNVSTALPLLIVSYKTELVLESVWLEGVTFLHFLIANISGVCPSASFWQRFELKLASEFKALLCKFLIHSEQSFLAAKCNGVFLVESITLVCALWFSSSLTMWQKFNLAAKQRAGCLIDWIKASWFGETVPVLSR